MKSLGSVIVNEVIKPLEGMCGTPYLCKLGFNEFLKERENEDNLVPI